MGRGEVARRRQALLDELAREGGLGARELQDRLSVPARTLERDFAALRDAAVVGDKVLDVRGSCRAVPRLRLKRGARQGGLLKELRVVCGQRPIGRPPQ